MSVCVSAFLLNGWPDEGKEGCAKQTLAQVPHIQVLYNQEMHYSIHCCFSRESVLYICK